MKTHSVNLGESQERREMKPEEVKRGLKVLFIEPDFDSPETNFLVGRELKLPDKGYSFPCLVETEDGRRLEINFDAIVSKVF